MKKAEFRADSGILERLQTCVPGLQRRVRSGSGKMSWIATGQGGRGNYLSHHFSNCEKHRACKRDVT